MIEPSEDPPTTQTPFTIESAHRFVTDSAIRLLFLGLLAFWSLKLVAPFVTLVIWAVVLTVALYPVYAWLADHDELLRFFQPIYRCQHQHRL